MDNEKILERVRKLYAMSQDTSSPNEAAIAARRARALMDEHGLSVDDLKASTDFGVSIGHETYKKVPAWYGILALGVARMNDCIVKHNGITVVFQGYTIDTEAAALMLDYLVQTMERHLRTAIKDSNENGRRFSSSFRRGFAADMQTRLTDLAKQRQNESLIDHKTGTALVVVKNQLVAEQFGRQRTSQSRGTVSSASGYGAGVAASQRTSLNGQVGGSNQQRLH